MATATKKTAKVTKAATPKVAKARSEASREAAQAKPTAEVTKAETPKVKKDGWGARLTTGRHTVNQAVIDAGADGAPLKDIEAHAAELARRIGVEPRKAVGTHLQALKVAGYVDNADRVWKATDLGRKQWKADPAKAVKLA